MAEDDQDDTAAETAKQMARARAFETMLRQNTTPLRVIDDRPKPETVRPKQREFLFRGHIYQFAAIGVRSEQERRAGIVERWQADIHADEDIGINVVVNEYYDGRFTPWTYEGIFFNDFLQAASVGVVSGGYQAHWHLEQRAHEKTRKKFAMLLPAAVVLGFMIGVLVVLR